MAYENNICESSVIVKQALVVNNKLNIPGGLLLFDFGPIHIDQKCLDYLAKGWMDFSRHRLLCTIGSQLSLSYYRFIL